MNKPKKKNIVCIGKEPQTINFDKIVLDKLKQKAESNNSTVSNLVNFLCRRAVMTDANYYGELAKHHYMEFQRYKYLKDEATIHAEIA